MLAVVAISVFVVWIGVTAWALNSRRAGDRGWVYNKYNPRQRGGGSLGLLEEIYQPSIRHVIEERSDQEARGSQDESGESDD